MRVICSLGVNEIKSSCPEAQSIEIHYQIGIAVFLVISIVGKIGIANNNEAAAGFGVFAYNSISKWPECNQFLIRTYLIIFQPLKICLPQAMSELRSMPKSSLVIFAPNRML